MKTLGIEKAKQYDRSYNSKISRTKSQVLYLVDDRTSGSIALAFPMVVVAGPASATVRMVYGFFDVDGFFDFEQISTSDLLQFCHYPIAAPITISPDKFRPALFWQTF